MTVVTPPTLLDHVVAHHHDYVWARLPFVVPMAIAAARRRGDRTTRELARLIVELRPLLLGHLDREEALLHQAAAAVTTRLRNGMHSDHVAVIALLEQMRDLAGNDYHVRDGADPTERALYLELARLDEHVHAQINIEEHLMTWWQHTAGRTS
jgi:iron-sulfur cluster repair protein YtfE (RIC family)